jgi:hypothetical protein
MRAMSQRGLEIRRSSEVDDSNLVLRRYLTPPKFTGLTTSGSLCFAPASSFSDESEGHYTQRDYDAWDQELLHAGFDDRSRARASSAKAKIAYWNRQAGAMSCWTAGPSEDLRMWREYGKSSDAVAIETTVGALRASLGPDFLIIPVTYLDFGTTRFQSDTHFSRIFSSAATSLGSVKCALSAIWKWESVSALHDSFPLTFSEW